jgi:hypothetical protein
MSEEYREAKKYTKSWVNSKRTKIAHEMQEKSKSKSKALKKLVGKEGYKPSKFIDHYK